MGHADHLVRECRLMRILIVEDEPAIAQRLERLLRAAAKPQPLVIECCAGVEPARRRLSADSLAERPIDAVFLDLNLSGHDGFELLAPVSADSFHVVVVSAHGSRALEAFEIGVLDFVPKPFNVDRLARTWARLQGLRGEPAAKSLAIRTPGRIEYVAVDDVLYVRAEGATSELVLRDGSVRFHPKSIDRLLTLLPPTFERVHRSYLLRLDQLVSLKVRTGSRYSAILESGVEIPVGRTRVEALRARLGETGGDIP